MGNADSKTVWDDKSATGGTQKTHTRQGPSGGGLIIYHIHDKEMRNSGTNLWMESILQEIQNNVLKGARSLTIVHKAPLSLHISFFFCGFIIISLSQEAKKPIFVLLLIFVS